MKAIATGALIACAATLGVCKIPAVAAPQGTLINNGGRPMVMPAGSTLTTAQLAAAAQVANGGRQNLVLDGAGRAVGGTMNLADLAGTGVSNFAIPHGVSATWDAAAAANLVFTGTLTNAGTLTALSSNAAVTAATLSTGSLMNAPGGVIQSLLSSLTFSSPIVRNAGVITSATGSLNFVAPNGSALQIDNTGGTISALAGTLAASAQNADVTIRGGTLAAHAVDLSAGAGQVTVNVDALIGTVATSASAAHVGTNSGTLQIGNVCVTGDPIYLNANGDVEISGNIDVAEDLTIIASRDVRITNPAVNLIQARDAAGVGHNINIIAGADVTGDATSATVHGASATGGDVDFLASTTLNINASSTCSKCAPIDTNITIAAFSSNGNGGHTLMPDAGIISVDDRSGHLGTVSMIAGAPNGVAIRTGGINKEIVSPTFPPAPLAIRIATAQPVINGGTISFSADGKAESGKSFLPGATNPEAFIEQTNLIFCGRDVQVDAGGITHIAGRLTGSQVYLTATKYGIGSEQSPMDVLTYGGTFNSAGDTWLGGTDVQIHQANVGGSLHATGAEWVDVNHVRAGNSVFIDGAFGFTRINDVSAPFISISQHDPLMGSGDPLLNYTGINAETLKLTGKTFYIAATNTSPMTLSGSASDGISVWTTNSLNVGTDGLSATNRIRLEADSVGVNGPVKTQLFEAHAKGATLNTPVLKDVRMRFFANDMTFKGTKLSSEGTWLMLEVYSDRMHFPDAALAGKPFVIDAHSNNKYGNIVTLLQNDPLDLTLGRVPGGLIVNAVGKRPAEIRISTGGNLYVQNGAAYTGPFGTVSLSAGGKVIRIGGSALSVQIPLLAGMLQEVSSSRRGDENRLSTPISLRDTTISPVDQNRSSIFSSNGFPISGASAQHHHNNTQHHATVPQKNDVATTTDTTSEDVASKDDRDENREYTVDTESDANEPTASYQR